jgi:hypothetical protein
MTDLSSQQLAGVLGGAPKLPWTTKVADAISKIVHSWTLPIEPPPLPRPKGPPAPLPGEHAGKGFAGRD